MTSIRSHNNIITFPGMTSREKVGSIWIALLQDLTPHLTPTTILNALMNEKEYTIFEKVLGIVDHDLYVPELNFVFGEASPSAAVISLTRLRQEFYNLPQDQSLFHKRTLTEAVHELGHTYGLGHCGNPKCVMFFSNSLIDTDRKGSKFCSKCKNNLRKTSSY
jgi:archaemetzincin